MRPAGPGKWSGQLYNTDDGMTLSGNLIDAGPTVLRVEGCVGGSLCGGEDLTPGRALIHIAVDQFENLRAEQQHCGDQQDAQGPDDPKRECPEHFFVSMRAPRTATQQALKR